MSSPAKHHRDAERRFEHGARQRTGKGIFGTEAFKWRGSILRLELEGEEPFYARLRETRADHVELEVLDAANLKSVTAQRILEWPPDGTVTVVRNV